MKYGINVSFFSKTIGLKRACELAAKVGFTELDYTPPVSCDNWEAQMKEALLIFADNGLTVHQTHAPFNRYGTYGKSHRLCIDRCAEATEFMGAKYMVVHGDEFDAENLEFSPEVALEYNNKLFSPYVERALRGGYKLAFETVFEDSRPIPRFTSQADDLLVLIKSFNSASAVCCWDFGHANVSFKKDAPAVIRNFGSLIECTHLHDNDSLSDSHQMPLTGDIDWQETVSALKDIGYNGIMSIEYAHGRIPEALAEDFIRLTYESAKHIWEA